MDPTTVIRNALLALDQPFYRGAELTPARKHDLQVALSRVLPAELDPFEPAVWQLIENCLATMATV